MIRKTSKFMKRKLLTLALGAFVAFSASAQQPTNQARSHKSTKAIQSERTAPHATNSNRAIIFADDFETDMGWTLGGEFERGAPQGLGGSDGNADPSSAFGGANIIGSDLSGLGSNLGDYETNIGDRADFAESPVIDCTGKVNVMLNFQQYLGVEENAYDHAYIDVSTDGGNSWTEIWANPGANVADDSWTAQAIDISALADNEASVQIRFAIGSSDGGLEMCGWNVDDFSLTGDIQVGNDLALNAILHPMDMMYDLTGTVVAPVVTVSNPGTNSQSAYDVTVVINDGSSDVYTETISDYQDLNAGETADLTFPDWTALEGFFTLTATVALSGDANLVNDERMVDIGFYTPGTIRENFELAEFLPLGWTETATESSFIHSDLSSWWTIDGASAGTFLTAGSAPEMLITPAVLVDANMIDIDYQTKGGNGSQADGFTTVQVKYSLSNDPMGTWTDIGAPVELDTDDIKDITVDISALADGVYYFAFYCSSTYNNDPYASASVFDNIIIEPTTADDMELTRIDGLSAMSYVAEGVPFTPAVVVTNTGTDSQDTYSATFIVNDGSSDVYSETVVGTMTLAQGENEKIVFPDWTPTTGSYTITATVNLAGDQFPGNDEAMAGADTYMPGALMEDFEGSDFLPNYWKQSGTENTFIHAGPGDWYALNDSKSAAIFQQIGDAEEMLVSPAVAVTPNMIAVNYQVKGGNGTDAEGFTTLQLKYATKLGGTLTDIGDAIGLNDDVIRNISVDISGLTPGNYFFVWAVSSMFDNGGTNSSACVLDNIMIQPTMDADMELTSILNFEMADYVGAGMELTPKVVVTNRGFNAQDSYEITVVINDGSSDVYSETIVETTSLSLDGGITVQFPGFTPTAASYTINADVTILTDDNMMNNSASNSFTTYAPDYVTQDFEGSVFLPEFWAESNNETAYQKSISFDSWTLQLSSAGVFQKAGMADELLVTRAVSVDANVVDVRYQARGFNGSDANGSSIVQLKYSTDLSGPWVAIGNPVNLNSDDVQDVTVDISGLADGGYYFAFVTSSTFTVDGFFSAAVLDNILINPNVAVETVEEANISIFPNPSNGVFTITAEDEYNVEVIDIAGKVVSTQVINSTSNTVNIENAGIYFLKMTNQTSSVTQRVIVK